MFRASAQAASVGNRRREALGPQAREKEAECRRLTGAPGAGCLPASGRALRVPRPPSPGLDQPWPERAPPSPRGSGPWLPLARRTQKAKQTLDSLLTAGNNYKVTGQFLKALQKGGCRPNGRLVCNPFPSCCCCILPETQGLSLHPTQGRPAKQGWSHRGSEANSHGQAVRPFSAQGTFQNNRWAQPGRCGPQPACRGRFTTALATSPFPHPLPATTSCLVPKQLVMKPTETHQRRIKRLPTRLQPGLVGHPPGMPPGRGHRPTAVPREGASGTAWALIPN